MLRVNMHEAKTKLSALAAKAEAGETVELMRAGKVIAVLGPRGKIKRKLGMHPDAAPGSKDSPSAIRVQNHGSDLVAC